MGNLLDLPNINPASFMNNGDTTTPKGNGNFNSKNYLNVRLEEGQTQRTITIRLLPMDLTTGNPFVKVHVHNVKVPKELASNPEKPYKDFICLRKNNDIDHGTFGNKCPFCEENNRAYEESKQETDPVKKKDLVKKSLDNRSREAVILRCIERGKEDEGVKFWKFKIRDDKTDPYNAIINLWALRKEEGERAGQVLNILDIYNGRDLNITITEGNSAPQILDASLSTPLSKDEEQMKKWIYDEKKWQDVFTCKPYEYLKLVSEMKTPWYDKEKGVWVDKEEYNAEHGNERTNAEAAVAEVKNAVAEMAKAAEPVAPVAPAPSVTVQEKPSFAASITVNDDDLPF